MTLSVACHPRDMELNYRVRSQYLVINQQCSSLDIRVNTDLGEKHRRNLEKSHNSSHF